MKNPDIIEVAEKVTVLWDPQFDVVGNPRPVPAEVTINMTDGRTFTKRVDYQKGTYKNPLTRREIEFNKLAIIRLII